ncbi:hypothetical protein CC85DRAFT_303196 [Cutaneotrichosporon oleaginosum]|uniref:SH3 domain-containing protein n=1 Tax=Cutaneotrichosporon oleaginosum TaxID=879819 RepID=A0A0J1B1M4_9TREE|nr:uncharacterized protein CC85DRAFT_303196 [Cutaneotrichosporon oleaginosum]KLT41519.1 hypothetical protein CC85DRAFT_303196 [Cutaneotrichosporon oleaginosum]TXT05832.1 hypothetical protein COLE_07152 [Cutaneotrichosporon oleaginosum]
MSPGISAPSSPTPTAGLTDTPRPRVRMNSMPPPSAPTDYVVRPQRPQAQSHDAAIPQYVDPPRVQKPLPTALPPPVGKPWVHDPSRPNFLPPACTSQPSPLMLLHDTLDIARDYREFVDTVGRLEHEYGRALQAAVKKFEGRLDAVNTPAPGGVKPPTTTLTTGMRGHLQEMNTVASLFTKRQDTLASQLGHPLHNLDRRIGESTRRLAVWNKEIRGRWEEGRQRVDTARAKYEAAVREHSAAEVKLRQCTPPELSSTPQVGSEWIKHEKLVAELERVRSDRKKAYIVALAGEGANGGGGRDVEEGGGACGWGEEARQLYGHVQNTMLELLRHHVEEDRAHYALLGNVISRLEATYAAVDLVRDQDTFLEWNTSSSSEDEHASPRIPTPDLSDSSSSAEPQSADSSHPSLRCFSFVAPPSAQYEEAVLDASKKDDRNWLINRWLISSNELNTLTDGFSKGPAVVKRDELARARQKCLDFAANRGIGDPDEMWERRMNVLRELGVIERRVVVTKAEMACLEAVLGPNPRPEMTHDFKERAFATPSQCDACHEKVWSPIKSELSCRHCAIALHKACGLHVEPECTGLKSRRRLTSGGRLRRSLTSGAMKLRRTTIYEAPHGGPVEVRTATPAHRHREPLRDDEAIISPFFEADTEADRAAIAEALAPDRGVQLARVRASFPAGGILELSVRAGEVVRVLEPDLDGSGWAKVRRAFDAGSTDQEGLVPLYALALVGSSTAPADGGCGIFVSADFTFPPPEHTLGVGEIAISKGAIYELTRVGMAFDELWCQLLVPGPDGARVKGVVPKTYVTVLDM